MAQKLSSIRIERLATLAVGVVIVGVLLVMVARGETIPSNLAGPTRFLLALAGAIFGAFLPGAILQVGVSKGALVARAAGAAAFFVVIWLSGPKVAGESAPFTALESLLELAT